MMNKATFLLAGMFFLIISCKKETQAPVSIYGKWYFGKVNSRLYNSSGKLLDTVSQAIFTSNDFVEYYTDGTGYFSNTSAISVSPSLAVFTFTLKGTALTQTGASQPQILDETVTLLTASALSVHAEYLIPDPNDNDQTDKEIDDYNYHR